MTIATAQATYISIGNVFGGIHAKQGGIVECLALHLLGQAQLVLTQRIAVVTAFEFTMSSVEQCMLTISTDRSSSLTYALNSSLGHHAFS